MTNHKHPGRSGKYAGGNRSQNVPDNITMTGWLNYLATGHGNMLIHAAAGYGKSHIIKTNLKAALGNLYPKSHFWLTATTALTAIGIDGDTIHSRAGLQRGKERAEDLNGAMTPGMRTRWKAVEVIVIEECSMLSAVFPDLLDAVAKNLKRKFSTPFGGVQIIPVGDFHQLAPIPEFVPKVSICS